MIKNKSLYIILFLCTVSLCAGAFYEVFLTGQGKEQLMDILSNHYTPQQFTFGKIFISNLASCFKIWFILFVCPIIPILGLASPLACIIKSFSLGFSATMLVETFGIKGIKYIFYTILPQGVIQLPIYVLLSICSCKFSILTTKFILQRAERKKNKNVLQQNARHYVIFFAISLFILTISALIEAYLKQFLL